MKNVILIIGLPGCGKSTISKKLSEKLGCHHLSTEYIRATLLGVNRVQADCDFTKEEQDKVYCEIAVEANKILKNNDIVLVEGVFRSRSQRSLLLNNLPVNTQVIKFLIYADEQIVIKRLIERKKQGTIAPAGVEGYKQIKKQFSPPTTDENYFPIDNTFDLDKSIAIILKYIKKIL